MAIKKEGAVGTYQDSGYHVFHDKLKIVHKAADRTFEVYRVCLLSHSS